MDILLDFTNKVVLITGAAQGFGKLLAQSLAERGAKLVLGDIDKSGVDEVAATLKKKGVDVVALSCDVSVNADCKAMVDTAVEKYGHLDIAVNNAGIGQGFTPLHETDEALMDLQFNVNVKGVQFGMRYQISQMLIQGNGSILNVSSMAGLGGAPRISAYCAAKHAVIGLTKTAALEYAHQSIRINAVCPYFALTSMVTNSTNSEIRERLSQITPMKRLAQPDEIVAMMVMMLSPQNTYMTGQCIAIDGGISAI